MLCFAVAVALAAVLATPPAAAQGGAKQRPSNLNAYSLRFWPRNSLQRGQTVSTQTPYGVLTCTSIGTNQPRRCSLR
jgi:hypothetical protein